MLSRLKHSKKVLVSLIVVQLIIIATILVNIYSKTGNVLGANVSVTPISKEDVNFPGTGQLKHFYEPLASHEMTITRPWDQGKSKYLMNSDALNERFDYPANKPDGVFRIITLGDSHTFGLFVKTADNYPEQLEIQLSKPEICKTANKIEIINLGVPGYDIEYSVERFKRRGQKYNPDLILWFIKYDDVSQAQELLYPYKEEYLKEDDFLKKLESREKGYWYPAYDEAGKMVLNDIGVDGIIEYQRRALEGINPLFDGKMVILTYQDFDKRKPNSSKYEQLLKDFVANRGETYYYNRITNVRNTEGFRFPDNHPNEQGYEIIVNELEDYLKNKKLIPCE